MLGKTAAFVLPILERLLFRPIQIPTTRVLMLVPTRELAVQVETILVKFVIILYVCFRLEFLVL